MRVIDFLPADYLERRNLRHANFICAAIGGGAILALGLVVGVQFVRSLGMARMRDVVQQQYEDANRQIEQLRELEQRKATLLQKVELSTALLERVPRSQLLARLTNHLPQDTSLTALVVRIEEVDVPVKAPPASAAPAAGTPAAKPAMTRVKRIQIRVDGLARTDVEVADYIKRLSRDPLFKDIDLQFSEEFQYQETAAKQEGASKQESAPTVMMRRFQLCFRLSPDAEKLMEGLPSHEPQAAAPSGRGTPAAAEATSAAGGAS